MMTPLFHVTLPPLGENSEESHFAPLLFVLEGMIRLDRWHIARSLRRAVAGLGEPIPPLYRSGIVYAEDGAGREDWRDIPAIIARGSGDCDNIVSWRVAELQEAGIPAVPVIKWQHLPHDIAVRLGYPGDKISKAGLWLVHCCVRWPDGTIEDPSKELGMGGSFTNKS